MNLSTAPTFPQHPGQVVRDTILTPKGLSVLAAAKLVGVGRPAFSNFVNGNAAVSSEMASRIEVTFGVPAQLLLDAQAAYDAAMAKTKGLPAAAKRYVVPLLAMKANDIENWVDHNIVARSRLAVFLRTLVNSTGSNLTKVDFPIKTSPHCQTLNSTALDRASDPMRNLDFSIHRSVCARQWFEKEVADSKPINGH